MSLRTGVKRGLFIALFDYPKAEEKRMFLIVRSDQSAEFDSLILVIQLSSKRASKRAVKSSCKTSAGSSVMDTRKAPVTQYEVGPNLAHRVVFCDQNMRLNLQLDLNGN